MDTTDRKHLIDVQDVVVEYQKNGVMHRVLNDVDLKVSPGEFVTVVGPTGCGKSTLLRLILGEEQPTSGKVLVDGHTVDAPNPERGIVFQRYTLPPHFKVLKNISLGLEFERFSLTSYFASRLFWVGNLFYREAKLKIEREAREYLQRIGLRPEDADKYPYELSGGMRQRVAIAKAMIMRPKVLLMDEPFGALDDMTRRAMQSLIIEKWKENKQTILFVTHDLEEAIFLGTRVIVLSQYYSTDSPSAGAKIVLDKAIPFSQSHDFKNTPEFNALEHQIRRDGLDPNYRQHVKEFDLSHPDSFRTVTPEEWRR